MSFFDEIKQSKAFKLIASYLGICFIILQVLDPLGRELAIFYELHNNFRFNLEKTTSINFFLLKQSNQILDVVKL